MKRITSLLLALCLIFSLSACDNENVVSNQNSSETVVSMLESDSVPSQDSSLEQTDSSSATALVGSGTYIAVVPSEIPAYSDSVYIAINDNVPNFSASELTTVAYETYSDLDRLGRCGMAIASCGKEIMPKEGEKRGSISEIKPSGWVQTQYDVVSGKYLYNRCHLIGWQLSAENANKGNLITGTRYMNTEGMLPFENMIADYINETDNHVAYRVTPIYDGNDLLASGVQLEAYSIEDGGEGVCFNVYVYNVQPGVTIDYATGKSFLNSSSDGQISQTQSDETLVVTPLPETEIVPETSVENSVEDVIEQLVWIPKTGSKYHSCSDCSNMKNPSQISKSEAEKLGYEPCKKCW